MDRGVFSVWLPLPLSAFCASRMSKLDAKIFSGTPRNLSRLAAALRSGDMVAVPTETVYGLAANALDPAACRKIFRAKRRPLLDPLIVHILGPKDMEPLAQTNPMSKLLARRFWPGPLTIVLEKKEIIPGVVSAGRDSVAIRSPSHPLFRRLLKLCGCPLAAPSANPFGYVSPTTAEHVRAGLGKRIRYILDGGPCVVGVESTILDMRDPKVPRILRPGAITRAQIERVLRVEVQEVRSAGRAAKAQIAPGMLTKHYSPRTPVRLHFNLSESAAQKGPKGEAWVFLARPRNLRGGNIHWMDTRGNLRRVARGLFATLRTLDSAGYTRLNIECPEHSHGLSAAISDRLRRAAARA